MNETKQAAANLKLTAETLEAGRLPAWAEAQATRLATLRTFQPRGWTGTGSSRAMKPLRKQLKAAGYPLNAIDTVLFDIVDMAQTKGRAA
jgi:hypothetical protein